MLIASILQNLFWPEGFFREKELDNKRKKSNFVRHNTA